MSMVYRQEQIIYQADPYQAHSLKSKRDAAYNTLLNHLNQWVSIETIDGHRYTGSVYYLDNRHVYLSMPASDNQLAAFGPMYNAYAPRNIILPLVLFELLVIALLA